ncbi:alcohol dehydrogenase catalytic domain-containing protein [Pseudomonas sp. NPDC089534]|uniref:alcohol dehydrogenase catalytic domain-containing protein n=1 Tax=Pseudomonas sp. NPDC089534 TaxID=3364468 RepID=UPI00380DA381
MNDILRHGASHLAIVREGHRVSLETVPTPSAGPGELLVAPLVAGLCGTDLQILRRERDDPARVIGHEGVARVLKVGAGVAGHLREGMNVILNPTHPDNPQMLLGHRLDGLFQQVVKIPAAIVDSGLVVPLPVDLPAALAPLIEPVACVIHALELMLKRKPAGPLIIYGDGIVGHLAALLAKRYLGVWTRVVMVHHSSAGLHWSERQRLHFDRHVLFDSLGAGLTLAMQDRPVAALIATPRSASLACLEHAVAQVCAHGVIDLIGGMPGDSRLSSLPQLEDIAQVRTLNCGGLPASGAFADVVTRSGKPLVLYGHRGVASEKLLDATRLLAQNPSTFAPLVTHLLPLPQAAELMQRMAWYGEREIDGERFLKVGIEISPCTGLLKADPSLHTPENLPCTA